MEMTFQEFIIIYDKVKGDEPLTVEENQKWMAYQEQSKGRRQPTTDELLDALADYARYHAEVGIAYQNFRERHFGEKPATPVVDEYEEGLKRLPGFVRRSHWLSTFVLICKKKLSRKKPKIG